MADLQAFEDCVRQNWTRKKQLFTKYPHLLLKSHIFMVRECVIFSVHGEFWYYV